MSDEFFEKVGTCPSIPRVQGQNYGYTTDAVAAPQPGPPAAILIGAGTSWASSGDAYWRIGESHDALPPGVYRCAHSSNIGAHFIKVKNETDKLIVFPDSESMRILEEIKLFQGMKGKFTAHGFLHKRGVLMWGPPGSGKTTTLQLLMKLIMEEHKGVAVIVDHPQLATACLQMLRAVEPERQLIGVMEDLDALVERHGESEFLALLDGESQVDNVVYVATTNYPERLDARFVDRPSRFDTIRYIGMPSAPAREAYFLAKVPELKNGSLEQYVAASDGYSVAHMREMIILTRCFGVPLSEAKKRLDKTRLIKPSSTQRPDGPAFGFGK